MWRKVCENVKDWEKRRHSPIFAACVLMHFSWKQLRRFQLCILWLIFSHANIKRCIEFNKSCESSHGDRRCLHNLSESFLQHRHHSSWPHLVRSPMHLPPSILVTGPSLLLTRPWSVAFSIMGDQRADSGERVTFVPLSHAVRGPEPRPSSAPSISLLSPLWEAGGAHRLPTFQCSLVWSKP